MLLVKNIAKIVGVDESGRLRVKGRDMNVLGEIDNAWLLADGDRIAAYGTMDKMPEVAPDTEVVDAEGGMLFPSFCDSHTHLVYAGSREQEFLDKINGLSYEEIAKRGGGILNSADACTKLPRTSFTSRRWNVSARLSQWVRAASRSRAATVLRPRMNSRCCG